MAATQPPATRPAVVDSQPPAWARDLFTEPLTAHATAPDGGVLVWAAALGKSAPSRISAQFAANAEDYDGRYADAEHFQFLFEQALEATGIAIASSPSILDLGSGSGANSIIPWARITPDARQVATDLSAELLAILARRLRQPDSTATAVCVLMDATAYAPRAEAFDLVTGSAILHHLVRPADGLAAAARALKPGGHAIFLEPFMGYALLRLAFERILVEADLRASPLDPVLAQALTALNADIAVRSAPDITSPALADLDDKWLFSRARIEKAAWNAGFTDAAFVPHNDHPSLYRDTALVQIRLATGRDDLVPPPWAMDILDGFDAAMPLQAKRELMLEGSIVLTKAR